MRILLYSQLILILLSPQLRAQSLGYTQLTKLGNKEFGKKVDAIVQKARAIESEDQFYERTQILKEAALLALSRPDKDSALIEIMPSIKIELKKDSAYEETLLSISKSSIRALQFDKITAESAATNMFILENMLSEIRPCLKTHPTCKDILIAIKDANLKVPTKAKSFRTMNGMFRSPSPSKLAERLYDNVFKVSK